MRKWLNRRPWAEYAFIAVIVALCITFALSLRSQQAKELFDKPLSEATIGDLATVAVLMVIVWGLLARTRA